MIVMEDIHKTYGEGEVATAVLRGVSFRVHPGEYVAIMGASGTGKSPLMNIIGCLDRPSSGRYLLDGADVGGLDDDALSRLRNEKIGFVFQQFHLLERTTALRNVMLPLIYAERFPDDAEDRAAAALAAVGLADRTGYRPSELSGGQQQRVAIARALIRDPEIILADEPTGALDRESGRAVMDIFARLHDEGRTVIVVTHDRGVAGEAERIITLEDGRIVADEGTERRRASAGHEDDNAGEVQ